MERITSAHNQHIKTFRQISSSSKVRKQLEQTIVEGVHGCEAFLKAGFEPVYVLVGDSALNNDEVAGLLSAVDEDIVISVPDSLFDSVSSLENGIKLLFVVDVPKLRVSSGDSVVDRLELIGDALLLDEVQDPGNVGTLLRTAAAAGLESVYLSKGSADAWSPKALRAGMGAQFVLNIYENVDLLDAVKNTTSQVLATSLQAEKSIYEKDLSCPTIWVFGNEGRGVSSELLTACTDTVIIPQSDGVESLNVAASVAVCLFEQNRQRVLK